MNFGAAAPAQSAPAPNFRQEALALLRLGAPIVATQVFVMGTGFSDVVMSGHYSTVDLAGVALGGAVLWPVFMFMTGLTMAVTPMVSQLVGARRTAESGGIIWQGAWLALFAALATMAIIRNAAPIFTLMGVEPDAAQVAVEYLQAVSWGMPPAMIYIALRQGSEGLGHTVPPMAIAAFALALNVPLNYLLIFGALGFPELGGVGCGWATAAVMWCELGMMALVTRRPYFRAAQIFARRHLAKMAHQLANSEDWRAHRRHHILGSGGVLHHRLVGRPSRQCADGGQQHCRAAELDDLRNSHVSRQRRGHPRGLSSGGGKSARRPCGLRPLR